MSTIDHQAQAAAERDGDLAWLMMVDAFIFQAEAEARWLELCEARLARGRPQSGPAAGTAQEAGAARDVERTP